MAKQQQEDPWSGFVDVLSNVVMVVTFLVIILGIAMFALAQQVAETMAADMLKAEESRQKIEHQVDSKSQRQGAEFDGGSQAEEIEALREGLEAELAAALAQRDAARASAAAASEELAALRAKGADSQTGTGSKGLNRVTVDRPLLQEDEVEGNTELTVRSRRTERTPETIVASAEEVAEAKDGVKRVERSDALLKIAYKPQLYKIDEETTGKLRDFFEGAAKDISGPIELRTFASSGIGSVSEARRVAFYRAMTIRSVAVAAGIDATRVRIVLRESEREEDADTVIIFAKP